jgi:hypothetical protein
MADDSTDPSVRRLLGEATAHGDEARRLVADFAKSRAPVGPSPVAAQFSEDFAEEVITGLHELAALQRARQSTVPDSGAMSVSGPGGWHVRRAPAWLVLALGVVAIVAACWAYVATH